MTQTSKLRVATVALPIGNPLDLSQRAHNFLAEASVIFCEDSRKLKSLLESQRIQSNAKWISLPGDEEKKFDFDNLAKFAKANDLWVSVSDAGTPVLNDPGRSLIHWARQAGHSVIAVPGPSAITAAWQWSGGFGLPFVFLGFAPKEKTATNKNWDEFFAPAHGAGTVVFFDTKHQIDKTMEALLLRNWAEQQAFVAREISKTHEELLSGTVAELAKILKAKTDQDEAMGELTLVLHGLPKKNSGIAVELETLKQLRRAPTKEASKIAAEITGISARECYQALLPSKEEE